MKNLSRAISYNLLAISFRYWLFVGLIIGAPLSKYPSVALPAYNFSSFRIGLYQLTAALFVVLCALPAIKKATALLKQNKAAFLSLCLIALVSIFGLIGSLNKPRSLLLVLSILLLLALVAAGWWYVRFELKKDKYLQILRYILYSGIVFSLLALAQYLIVTFTDANLGILCKGCAADIFGFPRVNVFTAEPQFLANSLLPFFFISLAVYFKNKSKLSLAALILTSVAIALTFSRGAFFACLAGLVFYFAALALYKQLVLKRIVLCLAIVVGSGLLGFILLVSSATYRYHSTPNITYNTVQSMLEHASLGVIKLPNKNQTPLQSNTAGNTPAKTTNTTPAFISPGLITSSTTDRLSASELALKAWAHNPVTVALGVGSGNLGPFVDKHIDASAPNNLTVYIYYVLVLAELGLAGLMAFIVFYANAIGQYLKNLKNQKNLPVYLSLAVINIAFLAQYLFFGTYINTVYVWLWAGILLGLSGLQMSKKL